MFDKKKKHLKLHLHKKVNTLKINKCQGKKSTVNFVQLLNCPTLSWWVVLGGVNLSSNYFNSFTTLLLEA